MKQDWKRDLPFEELLFDRWKRAESLGFGKGASIYHNSYVYGDVKVGENTWIGPLTLLDGSGGLEIGEYCSISAGVQIYSHNSVKWAVSKGTASVERTAVKIESYCFIGPNSIIKNGVSIGKHSVVGAMSFVNKNIPPFSIVGGSPCKKLGAVKLLEGNRVEFEYFRTPESL
jgi:acetyltransferase-like isoleucine patch superfamily enzyme